MISSIFNTALFEPLYNGLLFLTALIPGADIGIAIILLTLIVKLVLLPLSHKGTKTQARMRELEPEIKKIKDTHKSDKQLQAKKTMELYQKEKVSPFSGCFTIIIQLPIIIALYWVFWRGLTIDSELLSTLPHIPGYIQSSLLNQEAIYSSINVPELIKVKFLGLIDITGKSIVLAVLAGASQFFQIRISMGKGEKFELKSTGSIKDDLAKSMKLQMRYMLPLFVGIFAYTISAAVAIYWTTNNIFTIVHELIVKRGKRENKKP